MKLYSAAGTCALAPHIVLKWLKLPASIEILPHGDNRKPEYLKINPSGKVPALVLDSGRTLTEATAIMRFLADLSPKDTLDGTDPLEKEAVAEALSFMTSEVHANWAPFFVPERFFPDPTGFEKVKAKTFERLAGNYEMLNERLGAEDHMVLGRRTVADAYLYVLTRWGDLLPKRLEAYPELMRFRTSMERDVDVQLALQESGVSP